MLITRRFPSVQSTLCDKDEPDIGRYFFQDDPDGFLAYVEARDKRDFADQATTKWSDMALCEYDILQELLDRGCTSVPNILGVGEWTQNGKDAWVPGGLGQFLLMEQVPGVALDKFWDPDKLGREEMWRIRRAFMAAVE